MSLLVHKYELIKVKDGDAIQEMFERFNDIMNGIKALVKTYTNLELVFAKVVVSYKECYPKSQGSFNSTIGGVAWISSHS